jgi:transcription antitermination factor NusG
MNRESNLKYEEQLWYALYVKSRHEFVILAELVQKGIETFLPSAKRMRLWKDRRKLVEFPLFPGYVFVHIHPDPESHLRVLKARGAVNFVSLEQPGCPTSVPPEEINSIKALVESGQEVDVYPGLVEGARVRVIRGPLKSAEGILSEKLGSSYLLVNIEILGRSLGVRIYDDDVEIA